MRRLIKRVGLSALGLLVVAFLGIQFVPYGRGHDNPPVVLEPTWDSPRTRALAVEACFDCHSNETVWPWYSNIAPLSWWVQRHVDDGRSEVNFSRWDVPQDEADEIAKETREGKMPPWYYKPISGLTDTESRELIDGLVATFGEERDDEHRRDRDDDDDD
jgi:hypothetical protein